MNFYEKISNDRPMNILRVWEGVGFRKSSVALKFDSGVKYMGLD